MGVVVNRHEYGEEGYAQGYLHRVTLLPLRPCDDVASGKFRPRPGLRSHIPASPGYQLSKARGPDDGLMQLRLPKLYLRECHQNDCRQRILLKDSVVLLQINVFCRLSPATVSAQMTHVSPSHRVYILSLSASDQHHTAPTFFAHDAFFCLHF